MEAANENTILELLMKLSNKTGQLLFTTIV